MEGERAPVSPCSCLGAEVVEELSSSSESSLHQEIRRLEADKALLDARIALLRVQLERGRKVPATAISTVETATGAATTAPQQGRGAIPENGTAAAASVCGLNSDMIYRYSRHLLLPSFGVEGQFNLSRASVLVVGAGGLGSPVTMYLAACGIGCLGIVDNDIVELNNLHRQIAHAEKYIGEPKVKSAAAACHAINSTVKVVEHREALLTSNALDIMSPQRCLTLHALALSYQRYDIVVDATDNLPSRYMISDCCVLLGKPLVSGAALGLEGQLTVYHYNGGPCYRCLFPTPPPAEACQRCSDSGVLGVVPGVIGCLQALEAIKIASAVGEPLSGRMLLFDALSGRIRTVKLRGRSLHCDVCGEDPAFKPETFRSFNYESFTQSPFFDLAKNSLQLLPEVSRISSGEYKERVDRCEPHVLVDVRPDHHYRIAALANSISIPLSGLKGKLPEIESALRGVEERASSHAASLYVICRRGNDSQRAVKFLQENGFPMAKDIVGGLQSWSREVDPRFPMY